MNSFAIELGLFTGTDRSPAQCEPSFESELVSGSYDPWAAGTVAITEAGRRLVFDIQNIPPGTIQGRFKVMYKWNGGNALAKSIEFSVKVVEVIICADHSITKTTWPSPSYGVGIFDFDIPVFPIDFTFSQSSEPKCVIDMYKVKVTDPNEGSMTQIYKCTDMSNISDSASWTLDLNENSSVDLVTDQIFQLKPNAEKLQIVSSGFPSGNEYAYKGSYTIEITPGYANEDFFQDDVKGTYNLNVKPKPFYES